MQCTGEVEEDVQCPLPAEKDGRCDLCNAVAPLAQLIARIANSVFEQQDRPGVVRVHLVSRNEGTDLAHCDAHVSCHG